MPRYLSGRAKRTSQSNLSADRYTYLSLDQAEPNLGDPKISDIESNLPVGQQYQVISVIGYPGKRYWIPRGGGLIPGSISVYNEGFLTPAGGFSSITQLNFVGAAVSAQGYLNPDGSPGIAATITVFSPGNNTEVLFNNNNEFGTSSRFTFDPSTNLLSIGGRLDVGIGGTVLTTNSSGFVGIGTTNPTQELDVNGDIRLRGTIYDWLNSPGNPSQLLIKNNFGGLIWVDQQTVKAGAGGTYQNVQFHNSAGLIDGAEIFVYDEINGRVGIGSTKPKTTLDVRGITKFVGQTEIDFLNVTGVTTASTLAVSGLSTTRNLQVTGITTLGFLNGTDANYSGIVTATKFVGDLDTTNLNVTGIATIATLKVTGLTTTRDLQVFNSSLLSSLKVSGITTFDTQVNVNNLRVTGVSTLGNIRIGVNTVTTSTGQLNIDSADGLTRVNDILYVTDLTDSVSTDTGAIIVDGGVGIDKSLYVGGETHLATLGGITTAGGDMYIKGNLYVGNDITFDELFAQRGKFFASLETNSFYVSGVSTFIGVSTFTSIGIGTNNPRHSLHVQGTSKFTGISTFDSYIDANGGAYIDNIQIGIGSDNTINTTTGPLILDSATNSTIIDDQLRVSGISTFDSYIDANGGAYIDNIQIGITNDNRIDTSVGNLTLASNGGTTTIDSVLSVTGNASFDSNIILGNGISDNITFNGRVNSSIIPTGTVDIGSATNRWNVIYATTFNGEFRGTADKANTIKTISTSTNAPFYITFVDTNNSVIEYKDVYTDAGITYNPSTDTLSLSNLLVTNTSNFNGNVIFGNEITDTVSFTSRINSSILPSTNGTLDLGSNGNRWGTIYATNFDGRVIGNADTASRLSVGTTNTSNQYYLTFVNSNNTVVDYESFYTDDGIYYNPIGNTLFVSNSVTSGISTFNGNVTFGDDVSDTVTFTSRINSSVLPSSSSYDLGGVENRWGTIYATNFDGRVIGNADTASRLSVGTTNTSKQYYLTFVDSNNNTIDYESFYTDDGIYYNPIGNTLFVSNSVTSGISTFNGNVTFGDLTSDTVTFTSRINSSVLPSTSSTYDLGSVTNRWANVYADNFNGTFKGNADTVTKLQTPRNIAITGDLAWSVNFDGSTNVSSGATLATVNSNVGTYGNSTTIPQITVNAKGLVTAVNTVTVNFSTATVSNSDNIKTISTSTNAPFYPTFVDSNNSTIQYEALYTDGGITYNPSSDLLAVSNLSVSGIATFGDAITDTITYNSRIASSILPSSNNLYDLGGNLNRWKTIYADKFDGVTFVNSQNLETVNLNVTGITTVKNLNINTTGIVDGDIGSDGGTDGIFGIYNTKNSGSIAFNLKNSGGTLNGILSLTNSLATVNGDLSVNAIANFNGNVIFGNEITDTVSFTSRINSSILPSTNGTLDLGSNGNRWGTIYANTFNGVFVGNADTADKVSVAQTTFAGNYYLTLVNSNNATPTHESLYTDLQFYYDPSLNVLTVDKVKPSSIQDTVGGTGTNNQILTANGSGGWSWKSIAGGNGYAIGGITIQEEGTVTPINGIGIITAINFVGNGVTAVGSLSGIATITFPDFNQFSSNITSAQQAASTANTNATAAQQAASSAQTAASSAQTAASGAQQAASSAQTAASSAQTAASGAQQAASGAQQTANSASSTANAAQTAASSAQQAALGAQTAASSAQTAASSAQTAASSAQTAASSAQTAASTANTNASSAQQAASTANTNASSAQQAASSAQQAVSNISVTQSGYNCTNPITTSNGQITISNSSNGYGRRFVSSTAPVGAICDGDIWYDTSGTGGTAIDATPAGTIIYYASSTVPTGYLPANGAAVSRTTYAALFAAIGVTFGSGDGVNTFTLPDLRGEFVRGWDNGRGADLGRAFGSSQVDEYKSHTHDVNDPGHVHTRGAIYPGSGPEQNQTGGPEDRTTFNVNTGSSTTGISINANGGTETRPKNVALLACIKY